MIELRKAGKEYKLGLFGRKKLVAASDLSFSIEPGRIVSLIGESGSGKTTVGRLILRLIRPTSGSVLFRGEDTSSLEGRGLKAYYKRVQGVFQDPFSSFNPIFKADRVFAMIREEFYHSMDRDEWDSHVERALGDVGLSPNETLGKYVHQLSGGQLQRLLIARALLLEAEFLVADEIISMLDASTRVDVLNVLGDLKAKGMSILFITHDLNLGYYASDETLIMYRGALVEAGRTEEVFGEPLHPYTKDLLAAVPRLESKWPAAAPGTIGARTPAAPGEGRCAYFERCGMKDSGCARQGLVEARPGHRVACERRLR